MTKRIMAVLMVMLATGCNEPLPVADDTDQGAVGGTIPPYYDIAGEITTASGQIAAFVRIEVRGQPASGQEYCPDRFAYDMSLDMARVATDSVGRYSARVAAGGYCVLLFGRRDLVYVPLMSKSVFRTWGGPGITDGRLPPGDGSWDRADRPPAPMP